MELDRNLGYEDELFEKITKIVRGGHWSYVVDAIAEEFVDNLSDGAIMRLGDEVMDIVHPVEYAFYMDRYPDDPLAAHKCALSKYNRLLLNSNMDIVLEGIAENYIAYEDLDITLDELKHLIEGMPFQTVTDFVSAIFMYAMEKEKHLEDLREGESLEEGWGSSYVEDYKHTRAFEDTVYAMSRCNLDIGINAFNAFIKPDAALIEDILTFGAYDTMTRE